MKYGSTHCLVCRRELTAQNCKEVGRRRRCNKCRRGDHPRQGRPPKVVWPKIEVVYWHPPKPKPDPPYKLPHEPLQQFLAHRVQEIGVGNVAAAIGVDARIIYGRIIGRYMKSGQWYPYKFVQLDTVDRYCVALGYHPRDLYPDQY